MTTWAGPGRAGPGRAAGRHNRRGGGEREEEGKGQLQTRAGQQGQCVCVVVDIVVGGTLASHVVARGAPSRPPQTASLQQGGAGKPYRRLRLHVSTPPSRFRKEVNAQVLGWGGHGQKRCCCHGLLLLLLRWQPAAGQPPNSPASNQQQRAAAAGGLREEGGLACQRRCQLAKELGSCRSHLW